ncbi:MAG: VWA domain-containing protein [Pseudomonadota bacterium]
MLFNLFLGLRGAGVPVSLREHLTLIEALSTGLAEDSVERFYPLARAALVKDERFLDRFDRVFGEVFKGVERLGAATGPDARGLPEDWLRRLAEKHLTDEEKALVESLGGFEELMRTLEERLREQQDRHQGGNKWIGTAGTSPFGAYGYNPEGVRIGQDRSRHRRAVKVWDRRDFRNLDSDVEIGTRSIKVALRRLRRWAREGAAEELDLDGTIRATAHQGWLDVKLRPERHNAIKVLMLFDVGGSMDDHVMVCEELFSAARSEFKHLAFAYFHNCLYESVWHDNALRWRERMPTTDLLNTYGPDWKLIFVGDASMSPYEVLYPGGANEHFNEEAGEVWLRRALDRFPAAAWINPVAERHWGYTQSIGIIGQIMEGRMYPMTLAGLDTAIRALGR